MAGEAQATAEAIEMLEDEIEIARRDGSGSDQELLVMHAAHLCMLYLEDATEAAKIKAAELHANYPSAEHCAPPPPPPISVDCEGGWSPCLKSCADKMCEIIDADSFPPIRFKVGLVLTCCICVLLHLVVGTTSGCKRWAVVPRVSTQQGSLLAAGLEKAAAKTPPVQLMLTRLVCTTHLPVGRRRS
jgi:hypothetical protein